MKKLTFILFLIIPYLGFCQTDSTFHKEIELLSLLDIPVECRVIYKDDTTLNKVANHDAEASFNGPIKKYYRIGNASGILIEESQKLALNRYNLIIEYTHCTPCKYQQEYNKVFERLYFDAHKILIDKLIEEIEKAAREIFLKNLKQKK